MKRLAAVRRTFADDASLSETRYVIMEAGVRRSARIESAKTITVDTHPLTRTRFLKAVAVVTGRASPEVEKDEDVIYIDDLKAPTVGEAANQHRLILVAEDNVTNRNVILRQLNLLGYAAEVVGDGALALKAWRTDRYAILLTDCHMPNMDGYQLAAEIRAEERGGDGRIPIVAITANALQGEIDRCYEAGMDDYLSKPLGLTKLKDALRKWMPQLADGVERDEINKMKPAAELESDARETYDGPVDMRVLTDVFGDDPETIRDILVEFLVSARETMAYIEDAFEPNSAKDVGDLCHDLKSSSRQIGAHTLADVCATLERAGKEGDWPTIERDAPKLRGCMSEVAGFIDEQS